MFQCVVIILSVLRGRRRWNGYTRLDRVRGIAVAAMFMRQTMTSSGCLSLQLSIYEFLLWQGDVV